MRTVGRTLPVLVVFSLTMLRGHVAEAQVLYGFGFLPGQTDYSVFTINPATGAFTSVVSVGPVPVSTVTFDPVGKRLFFLSPPSTLYTVNLTSGAISTAPVGNCCAFLFVAAPVRIAVPVLGPTALLALLGVLSLIGATLARGRP